MRNYCLVDKRETDWKEEDVRLNDGKIYHAYQCQSCKTIVGQKSLDLMQRVYTKRLESERPAGDERSLS